MQALQTQMEDLEKKYQEALETFPDLKRWFGKHIDTYVPEEVKNHAAKYNPLLETVRGMVAVFARGVAKCSTLP